MTMIRALIVFELVRRLKVVSTYVYALLLFGAGFLMMLAAGGTFSSVTVATGNERVYANSPQSLFGTIGIVALFGIFTVAAIFGQAAYQDFGHGTWMIIFTKNVRKTPYLIGRFLGAFLFSCLLFLSIGLGQALGAVVVHFTHPAMIGPTRVMGYVWPYLTLVWPMLFFTGALFFALAAITRKMAPVYVGAVVLILGYLLTTTVIQDVENLRVAGLLDPFGFLAFGVTTRYWTPAEQNRDLAPLIGLFGLNRLIFTLLGAVLVGVAMQRFRTTVDEQKGRGADDGHGGSSRDTTPFPTTTPPAPTNLGWARASVGFAWMHFKEIIRSAVYWALITSAVFFGTLIVLVAKEIFGTATIPVTYQALELTTGSFRLFGVIIVTFYAGELVWRERDVNASDIFDATRAPSWAFFLSKMGALFLVAISIEFATAIVALISQLARGFFAIDLGLYFTHLFLIDLTALGLSCALALVVHVLVNHKYIGHAMMVLYYILRVALLGIGVEEPMVRYGSDMPVRYSDMNGYGHFITPLVWFRAYWWGFAIALLTVGYVFFVRGRETRFRARMRQVHQRLGVLSRLVLAIGLVLFVGAGSFIYYNTHVLHKYETAKDGERQRARYEKSFKAEMSRAPQPSITNAETSFEIFPNELRMIAKGTYRLTNKTTQPIAKIMINVAGADEIGVRDLRIGETKATTTPSDRELDVYWVNLPAPMSPNATADLVYDFEIASKGFSHGPPRTTIVYNGTFANNFLLPIIGYHERVELESDRDRKSYGLPPKERMRARDDAEGIAHNYIRQDSDFITFTSTVSTSADQIAMTPGYLEKEWIEGDRRYFRYTMDQPILNFFSVLSARYSVRRDEWNGVKLEILYHAPHTYNLDRMMAGMKDALAYCTEAFGPYQHRQARILEFPRYEMFAQSFPNTIPYSEQVGFIARVRPNDPDDVDYPYYVTAHEIAHQWWAHQVVGANVRGATMTSESMAQYSALMVMKKKYGAERMRRFLKFELDGYLRGRFMERKKELPLAQNENQQYIHYQKGSIAMYTLQDYIGEDRVNRALRKVVEKFRMSGPPYPTAKDLLDAFREETPQELQYLIEDLFETITLYDNRAMSATMKQLSDGKWDVTLKVFAKKTRSDDKGNQTELDFEDLIDVGALDEKDAAIVTEKRKVRKGESEIHFTVPTRPTKVGIDPLNKLIDRDSSDNVTVPSSN